MNSDVIDAVRDINVFNPECPGNKVITKICDKWTVLVIFALTQGKIRYSDLQSRIQNISSKMLTQTLRRLEESGLVLRTVHPEIPPKVEYELTPLGLSLAEALAGICIWAEENYVELNKLWRD